VIAPDLRGYGATEAPPGGPRGEGYSKREMADDLVELMARLGHRRFALVGHDRGARVAYRLALDHPHAVSRVALLNVCSNTSSPRGLAIRARSATIDAVLISVR
jgi:haloacetate dehalogenase